MKFNKRDKEAFDCLRQILDFYEDANSEDTSLKLTASNLSAIKEIFGIELKDCTFYKKEVINFVKGKDKKHLVYLPQLKTGLSVYPYGYFPFQVKEGKKNRDADEKKYTEKELLSCIASDCASLSHLINTYEKKTEERMSRQDFNKFKHQEYFIKYCDILNKCTKELGKLTNEIWK